MTIGHDSFDPDELVALCDICHGKKDGPRVAVLNLALCLFGIAGGLARLWWIWWTTGTCPDCGLAPRNCEGHPENFSAVARMEPYL